MKKRSVIAPDAFVWGGLSLTIAFCALLAARPTLFGGHLALVRGVCAGAGISALVLGLARGGRLGRAR